MWAGLFNSVIVLSSAGRGHDQGHFDAPVSRAGTIAARGAPARRVSIRPTGGGESTHTPRGPIGAAVWVRSAPAATIGAGTSAHAGGERPRASRIAGGFGGSAPACEARP